MTDGVVYSSNRDSFVNWDMTLGTKWTAEEYTNSQGTVKPHLSQTEVGCVFRGEFGPNGHREDKPHFIFVMGIVGPLEPILT